MVYCKKFEDGTNCVVDAPDGIPQEIIDFAVKMGRSEFVKRRKLKKMKTAGFTILGFCAAAVSAIIVIGKILKKGKERGYGKTHNRRT